MPAPWNKYGLTVARKHGKPGREVRPSSTTIDIHSHVAIPEAAAFVKPHLDPTTIPLTHFADAGTKALNRKQEKDIRFRITAHDERLADMDAMGIDMQLVLPPPNQCTYTVPLNIAQATLGTKISVRTLSGKKVAIKIPPGTPSGKRFRVRGQGIQKGEKKGDLIVEVSILVPEKLSEEQERMMKEFAESGGLKY